MKERVNLTKSKQKEGRNKDQSEDKLEKTRTESPKSKLVL